ncbi:hypothetical protein HF086_009875 [Spodoptera exigua]|uniref:Peptidase S8 pro-domain domain-containing protein n=1 Tax=Spodoptera exigua TaxID=7107 RepID=A0A922SAC3_SPOEX|nr:hypothetical protein HF086_009875 [Spodoptera exigua]
MLAYVVVVLTVLDVCVPLYHHQFAVFVPGGPEKAHELAHRHGFINHGEQFSYEFVSKPSVNERHNSDAFDYEMEYFSYKLT